MDMSHQRIEPYDAAWPAWYEAEADRLRALFGDTLLDIEHIGSTSIPGLASKPIIDLMVQVPTEGHIEAFIPALAELGYPVGVGGKPSTERQLFRKGAPTRYHLSIAYADKGSFWKRQLAFRDYLRTHPDDRDRYAALKQVLIAEDPTGLGSYIGGKAEFVNAILDASGFVRWKRPEEELKR